MISVNHAICGKVSFRQLPSPDGGWTKPLEPLGDWPQKNLVRVQLAGMGHVKGYPAKGVIFYAGAAAQLKGLFDELAAKDLTKHILTWNGAYYPRMIRGSSRTPSNHSFGTAFDINAAWNGWRQTPAATGKKGSVRALVPIAEKWGFRWGGDWKNTPDGMHLEVARLVKVSAVEAKPASNRPAREIVQARHIPAFVNGKQDPWGALVLNRKAYFRHSTVNGAQAVIHDAENDTIAIKKAAA